MSDVDEVGVVKLCGVENEWWRGDVDEVYGYV